MSVLMDRGARGTGTSGIRTTGARMPRMARSGLAVPPRVAPARPRRGEPRRPPTRVRAVAGRGRVTTATCPAPRRTVRWPLLAALAVAVAFTVTGLGLLGDGVSTGVPERTALVSVAPGETLWDLAERMAPGSDTGAVVRRIQELNELSGAAVPAGLPLAVPYEPGVALP
ncbi:LysM domain-containing protein [Amycolatopsis arida]|uniref:LysM domain-containing protein n=1 Tax=Amycolatopsis arida TaxID=587909 RepID=A0A1I5XN68_9PSEU|nr:LysM peptidoglycan-binding domain-containing protein [Amycolatopsis arida]TDX97348.1 LysM domain-containing protein [Amycolatopsis arida]SFQ33412.1 LysM domain-containing protein [Amycolatopsis arida]